MPPPSTEAAAMNPARPKQIDDDIQDPIARKFRDWFRVIMGPGIGFAIACLTIMGCIWLAWELVPAYRVKIVEEGSLAKETREAITTLIQNESKLREEYATHESDHVAATAELSRGIERTNTLLEASKAMMSPAIEAREKMLRSMEDQTRVLEEIRDKTKALPGS